jgi:hypothetical protein
LQQLIYILSTHYYYYEQKDKENPKQRRL